MNLLRTAVETYRATFMRQCAADFIHLAGLTLLFWVNWQIGLGVFLILAARDYSTKQ